MLADKKDVYALRTAATLWLEQNPGHPHAEPVRRALFNTNTPKLGRPRISEELRQQVIQLKQNGLRDMSVAAKLGISHTAVGRIWKIHLDKSV